MGCGSEPCDASQYHHGISIDAIIIKGTTESLAGLFGSQTLSRVSKMAGQESCE